MKLQFSPLLLLLVFCVLVDSSKAQLSDISLYFVQQSLDDGGFTYGVEIVAPGLPGGGPPGSAMLEAPDGTIIDPFFFAEFDNMTFEELGSRFFGDWKAEEYSIFTDETASHSFTVSPFELDDVFKERATIVSPETTGNLGFVETEFELAWEFPSGAVPTGKSVSVTRPMGSRTLIQYGRFEGNSVPVTVLFEPGVDSEELAFSAGSFERLPDLISEVAQDVPGVGSDLIATAYFRNLSAPITLTVTAVPEPSTSFLLGLWCCLIWQRRCRVGFVA